MNKKSKPNTSNIQHLLDEYSRAYKFRLESHINTNSDPTVGDRYIGIVENSLCHDKMTIYLSIDNEKVTLQHYGNYCALAHASAELFCTLVHNIKVEMLMAILHEIRLYYLKGNVDDLDIIENFPDLKILMLLPMSPTRKRCVMLPWEATMKALDI